MKYDALVAFIQYFFQLVQPAGILKLEPVPMGYYPLMVSGTGA